MQTDERVCSITECESSPEQLTRCTNGAWICDDHYEEARAVFTAQAIEACKGIGLTEDEAEDAVAEYNFTI